MIKKIGVICLCLASLSLVGCFHVPDEDWLPSKNKVNTGNTQSEDVEKALNSFMEGIDMVSSQRNERKNIDGEEINIGSGETTTENPDVVEIEDEISEKENTDGEEDAIQE